MKEFAKSLISEFSDKDYAHSYMESHTVSRIAAQIHALRKQRGWSQAELAKRAGISQERVSKIESADFESLTFKTLWNFSKAFDVHLHIAFIPFSQGIMDVANLSPERLQVEGRDQDLTHVAQEAVVIQGIGSGWKFVDQKFSTVTHHFPATPVVGARESDNRISINFDKQPIQLLARG